MPTIDTMIMALNQADDALDFNRAACVRVRNCHSTCKRCVDACPVGALAIADDVPALDAEACLGCGICAAVCPTGALTVVRPTDEALIEAAKAAAANTDGQAIFADNDLLEAAAGLYDPEKVVGLPSIGRVNESILLDLATAPGITRVTLVRGTDEAHPLRRGDDIALQACRIAEALLQVWHSPLSIRCTDKLPGTIRAARDDAYDKGRREFFSAVREETKKTAMVAAEQAAREMGISPQEEGEAKPTPLKVDGNRVLPQTYPPQRKLLLDALDALGEPRPVKLTTPLWGSVDIDAELCDSCRMCATFCPTGALYRFHTQQGKVGLKHRPRMCVACGCCEDMCPKHALALTRKVVSTDISSGSAKRFVMEPVRETKGTKDGMLLTMREMLGTDLIGER